MFDRLGLPYIHGEKQNIIVGYDDIICVVNAAVFFFVVLFFLPVNFKANRCVFQLSHWKNMQVNDVLFSFY